MVPEAPSPDSSENASGSGLKSVLHPGILQLSKVVRLALRRAATKKDRLLADLQEARASTIYQQYADSLLAQLTSIPHWAATAEIVNVHTDTKVTVTLKPELSPEANAELFYKRARKGLRGITIIESRLNDATTHIGVLEAAAQELECLRNTTIPAAEISGQLDTLQTRLEQHGIWKTPRQGAAPFKQSVPRHLPYRHLTIDKWSIYVGRSDKQNDELITRFAQPSDIWMHAASCSGSHVIIRRNKFSAWPPQKILDVTASFAAWYSAARNEAVAEVHITEKRYVCKRRHSPAGQVVVSQFKTVAVAPCSPQEYFNLNRTIS